MTPQDYAKCVERASDTGNWQQQESLLRELCQAFADRRDWNGLKQFFEDVLRTAVSMDVGDQLRPLFSGLAAFKSELTDAFELAAASAKANSQIQAIYFEYFFDGGDGSIGAFYLCTRYAADEDDWAAHFDPDGVITGPSVQNLLNFDPDMEWDEPEISFVNAYAHACLLATLGETLDAQRYRELPVGFAQHDGQIVHIGQ